MRAALSALASATVLSLFAATALLEAQTPSQTPPTEIPSSAGAVRIERLATLEYPWGMAVLPDGRLLITEKPGRLRLFKDGKLSEPIGGVPKVAYRQQGGLSPDAG